MWRAERGRALKRSGTAGLVELAKSAYSHLLHARSDDFRMLRSHRLQAQSIAHCRQPWREKNGGRASSKVRRTTIPQLGQNGLNGEQRQNRTGNLRELTWNTCSSHIFPFSFAYHSFPFLARKAFEPRKKASLIVRDCKNSVPRRCKCVNEPLTERHYG